MSDKQSDIANIKAGWEAATVAAKEYQVALREIRQVEPHGHVGFCADCARNFILYTATHNAAIRDAISRELSAWVRPPKRLEPVVECGDGCFCTNCGQAFLKQEITDER